MKNSASSLVFILFVLGILCSDSLGQCPNCSQLLTQGWYYVPNSGHTPSASGNLDEFGIIDTSPFLVKVDNYPPIKSFPKTYSCNPPDIFYMSFDTDNQNIPIPFNVVDSHWHNVNIFRENGVGYSVSVKPPSGDDVGDPADFIMNFNTTEYDKAWDPSMPHPNHPPSMVLWVWNYFVQNSVAQDFEFQGILEGPIELTAGQTTEFVANIIGGSGNYGFK